MRTASVAVLREIRVETGGSNVQFAVNLVDGRMVVIEMNPRVSRSSALASEATGFPGRQGRGACSRSVTSLDELMNDITGATPALVLSSSIDYVVNKIPRFAFEKYPGAEPYLTTSMKSVGEVMAIGRTFAESLQKALRGLETGLSGLDEIDIPGADDPETGRAAILRALGVPAPDRLLVIAEAFRHGLAVEEIQAACAYEPWFLRQIETLVAEEAHLRRHGLTADPTAMRRLKAMGFSDARLGMLTGQSEMDVRKVRQQVGVRPVFKRIDTWCAGEFPAPRRPTCIRPMRPARSARRRCASPNRRIGERRSSSAAAPTASARASSSTIAAATRPLRSTRSAWSRSWSTATRRPSPPTMTPPIGSISSP